MRNVSRLQGELKSKSTAWIMFLFLGCHYGYVGKWGLQILFWLTLGGLGVWTIVSFFTIGDLVKKHNNLIYDEIDRLEEEKEQRNLEKLAIIAKS